MDLDFDLPIDFESFGDTTVLQFGLLCSLLAFIVTLAWMHYTSKGQAQNLITKSYAQKW